MLTKCPSCAQSVSPCPGCGTCRSGGGVPGVASCPRGPFWSPHCQEIGGGGSDLHRQWRALTGRAGNLRILCDQLEHTEVNLKQLEEELELLITTDPATKGLQQMPEL